MVITDNLIDVRQKPSCCKIVSHLGWANTHDEDRLTYMYRM